MTKPATVRGNGEPDARLSRGRAKRVTPAWVFAVDLDLGLFPRDARRVPEVEPKSARPRAINTRGLTWPLSSAPLGSFGRGEHSTNTGIGVGQRVPTFPAVRNRSLDDHQRVGARSAEVTGWPQRVGRGCPSSHSYKAGAGPRPRCRAIPRGRGGRTSEQPLRRRARGDVVGLPYIDLGHLHGHVPVDQDFGLTPWCLHPCHVGHLSGHVRVDQDFYIESTSKMAK